MCLSEAKASLSHRMWAEVFASAPHILHKRLLFSPNTLRCLLKLLRPEKRPTLDCVLLKHGVILDIFKFCLTESAILIKQYHKHK